MNTEELARQLIDDCGATQNEEPIIIERLERFAALVRAQALEDAMAACRSVHCDESSDFGAGGQACERRIEELQALK